MSEPAEYALRGVAGRGGAGEVWEATRRDSGERVAVKRLREDVRSIELIEEIRAIAALEHPHVVPILDADPDGAWFVMPWADGTWDGARLGWSTLRALLAELLAGLAHAHARGRLHLDVKPSNLLRFDGATRLADFGVSRARQAVGERGLGWGSAGYASPEQREARWRDVGPPSDLYGLGRTGLALLVGRPPDPAGTDALLAALPDPLAAWFARLVDPDPDRRFDVAPRALAALPDADLGFDVEGARAVGSVATVPFGATRTGTVDRTPATATAGTSLPSSSPPKREPREGRSLGGGSHRLSPLGVGPLPADRVSSAPALGTGLSLLGVREIGLVGRDAERAALWNALARVAAGGRPVVCAIEGPSGVGASHLARWLATSAAERGASKVFAARGAAVRVHDAIALGHGVLGLDWPDAVERITRRGLDGALIASAALPEAEPSPGLLAGALAASADPEPALVIVDDAGLAPDAIELALALLGREDGRVLAVLVRPPDDPRLAGVERIALGPLAEPELEAALVARLRLDPGLADRLVAQTGGMPAWALGVIAEAARMGALAPGPRGLTWAATAPLVRASDRFHALDAWLDAEPDVSDAAERAALLGDPFEADVWAEVATDGGSRERALAGLLTREMIARHGDGWSFREPLARAALIERATRSGRDGGHHAALADALAARGASPARRGPHLLGAGRLDDALDALLDGATTALAGRSLRQVGALLDQAARCLDGLGERGPRRVRFEVLTAHLDSLRGRLDDAERAATAALERLEGGPATLRGYAERVRASVALLRGDRPAAAEGYLRARAHYVASGEPVLVALCDLDRGGVLMWIERLDEAEQALDAAWSVLGAGADRVLYASACIARSRLALFRGDRAAARRESEAAVDALSGRPSAQRAIALNDLGLHALHDGDLDAAEAALAASEQMMIAIGFYAVGHPRLNRARVDAARGRFDDAQRRLDAVEDGPALAAPQMRALRLALEARVAAGRRDWARVDAALVSLEAGPAPRPSPAGDPCALLADAAEDADGQRATRLIALAGR